jgi:hypothetical protein|tara:strand:- start:55 stop:213 length:159 start_codon:yes stop_codon:yes gene_type:complete
MTAKDMNTTLIQKIRKINILPTRFIEPLLARPHAGTDVAGETRIDPIVCKKV